MTLSEIRELGVEELLLKEKELRKELFNLRYQLLNQGVSNPQRIKDARREIARIQTICREKKVVQETSESAMREG